MVTKWQSTDLWWKSSMERELQPGKIVWKGSWKSTLLSVYLFTGLCWFTSREPGAVNLDVNVSSLWGIVSVALSPPTFWGLVCTMLFIPVETAEIKPGAFAVAGIPTAIHIVRKKFTVKTYLTGLHCHSCFCDSQIAENFAFWRCMFCWSSQAWEIPGRAQ